MSQYPSFHYTFSILFVTYLSFSWFSWKIPITTSPENFFFMDIEKPFTFFMVKKGIKSNHNNLLFNYWPCPSYIFINLLFTWKFWVIIFGFPKDIVLRLLILCIGNSDQAYKKRRKIITFTKEIVLQFYRISCFTYFYGHISLTCY